MSFWARDPELFLHKGRDGVVHLRRCKKETTTTSSMLMRPEDFKDEGVVTDHLSLYGGFYEWDKKKYEALIGYIYSKHLLVNSRGSLIVEVATDDKAAPVVYIRALDILAMESYGLPDRTVPARTVRYLQEGTVVPTNPNPKETKLTEDLAKKTKEVETLQQDLANEKKENTTLRERNAKLEEDNKNCGKPAPPILKPTTYRVYTKADTDYSLTIRDGQVILGKCDNFDVFRYWIKDDKYGATVKDAHGSPSFALVNEFTGQAMKHPTSTRLPVQLVPYNPAVIDESLLWTERSIGDGYNTIRMVNNPVLMLDAFNGDQANGGVRDGTIIKVWEWSNGRNQHWNIVPDRTVPAITVRCGTGVPTDPNPKETKLTEDLAKKTKEVETLQQDLANEKKENTTLRERNAKLEEDNKNCGKPAPPILKPTTYRVYTKADTDYSLTIRDGQVILGKCDKFDVFRYWIKDVKYGETVKDAHGSPSFALVNEFTGQAMKHPAASREPVQLVPYNPAVVDESILWTEKAIGDGYNNIMMVNNTGLILDAFNGDQAHGGVRDGTIIKVWEWSNGKNQHWNIVPCSKPDVNQPAP